MSKSIDAQVGICNTEYALTEHRDGSVTVSAPYIRWSQDQGTLRHRKIKVTDDIAPAIRQFFDAGELILAANNGCGALSLEDVLNGYLYPGVQITGTLR